MSVIKDFVKLKKYNLQSLAAPDEHTQTAVTAASRTDTTSSSKETSDVVSVSDGSEKKKSDLADVSSSREEQLQAAPTVACDGAAQTEDVKEDNDS